MRPYLGPPWTDSHQICAVDVFHHVPPIHGVQNAEVQKTFFCDVIASVLYRGTSVCVTSVIDVTLQWQIWSTFVTVVWCSKTKTRDGTGILVLVRILLDTVSKIDWQFWHIFFKNALDSVKGVKKVRLQPRIEEKLILERLWSSKKFGGTSWNVVGTYSGVL